MKKFLTILTIIFLAFAMLFYCLFQISKSRTFQTFGEIIPSVPTEEKIVALTFDDGPTKANTDTILKILEEENIKATFFLIGSDMEKNPGEAEKIIDKGHEVGNHSYSHQRMVLVSSSFVKDEIEKTDRLIRNAGFQGEILFRPPYGKKLFTLPYYLSNHKRKSITWDVEPETWEVPPKSLKTKSNEVIKYTVENTKNGSIILLHVMYKQNEASLNSVKPIISGLRQKGFEFVTVSELLKNRNN